MHVASRVPDGETVMWSTHQIDDESKGTTTLILLMRECHAANRTTLSRKFRAVGITSEH